MDMADDRYGYKDFSHPDYHEHLRANNYSTLRLVKTVAEFAEKISEAHNNFARSIQKTVETFKRKHQQISQDRGPLLVCNGNLNHAKRRLTENECSLIHAWENLLQESQYDAQANADTATLLLKNVYAPLAEICDYKKAQNKRLCEFRSSCESLLHQAADNIALCEQSYVEAYKSYRSNMNSRDAAHYLAEYHNAHNELILRLRAGNKQHDEFNTTTLPYVLGEMEEINIDLTNTVSGSLESHVLLLVTKANEQARRFESILKLCKQVAPQQDIHNYLSALSHPEKPVKSDTQKHEFTPPNDPNIPGSELSTLPPQIILDKHTEQEINTKRNELQKEAAELTSYLRQNQDVTQTLMNVCQRNLANHLYSKVYETQDDLCRKRNDIRMAHLQLSAIRAQIELLSGKAQNGGSASLVDVDQDSQAGKHSSKASIKGMWKKAFKSLKSKDQKNQSSGSRGTSDAGESGGSAASTPVGEEKPQYKRMVSTCLSDTGLKSHESEQRKAHPITQLRRTKSEVHPPKRTHSSSSSLSFLINRTSRQSSMKKGFFRKDSKESPREEPETPDDMPSDPVFCHLKYAAEQKKSQMSRSLSIDSSESSSTDRSPRYMEYPRPPLL